MARWIDHNPQAKAITASSTAPHVWNTNDIPGPARGAGNLVGVSFAFQYTTAGTTITVQKVNRVKWKASGNLLWDCSGEQLRGLYGRMSPANVVMTGAAFTCWFNAFDVDNDDEADQAGFPVNTIPTCEITFDGTQGAGSMFATYIYSDIEASSFYTLIGQPMGIAASQNSAGYALNETGRIRGMGINSVGMQRVRLTLGGRQWVNALGPGTSASATDTLGDSLRETQQIELDQTFTQMDWFRLPNVYAPAGSRIEVTTNTAWAGVSNEVAIWAQQPQAA